MNWSWEFPRGSHFWRKERARNGAPALLPLAGLVSLAFEFLELTAFRAVGIFDIHSFLHVGKKVIVLDPSQELGIGVGGKGQFAHVARGAPEELVEGLGCILAACLGVGPIV